MIRPALICLAVALCLPLQAQDNQRPLRWWKGNLHTHSLWSDGDQFPEMIASWYAERDYHFLALTDHNTLSEGERWMRYKDIVRRSHEGILDDYRKKFGNEWVETRGEPGSDEFAVRLKPLTEFRALIEEKDRFLLIQAEEISDRSEGKPVHINASNIAEVILPAGGKTVREAMENNLRAILQHQKDHGREVLPHINHPNFGYAITAEDLAAVVSERFFEVYNGHPSVNHLGNQDHPGVERIWDLANAIRRTNLDVPPLMGIATDDSHEYHGKPGSRPGRGWIMVRSRYLTPDHLIRAIKAGDFYASSGVKLESITYDQQQRTLSLKIMDTDGGNFTTQFVGTLKSGVGNPAKRIGKVLATEKGNQPRYQLTGDELYVRAVVTSSLPAADPAFKNQKQQAWTQPVGWRKTSER